MEKSKAVHPSMDTGNSTAASAAFAPAAAAAAAAAAVVILLECFSYKPFH